MKKILILSGIILLFGACQESSEDRAARELSDYTKKNCPTPVINDQQMDSVVYEPATHTIHSYYRLLNKVDNEKVIKANLKQIRAAQLKDLKKNTWNKAYKDAGFVFRYTYRSGSDPQKVLVDETFTQKDYK